MNITQQLKESARKYLLNSPSTKVDSLVDGLVTELIEHIEGEIPEAYGWQQPEQDEGYQACRRAVLSLLENIKQRV